MNRTEFITVTAIILFGAFLLGWIASWIVHRLTRRTRADMSELDRMAQQLHDTEEQRDQAVARLEEVEADLSSRLAGTESELQAAMDGLRERLSGKRLYHARAAHAAGEGLRPRCVCGRQRTKTYQLGNRRLLERPRRSVERDLSRYRLR